MVGRFVNQAIWSVDSLPLKSHRGGWLFQMSAHGFRLGLRHNIQRLSPRQVIPEFSPKHC